MAGLGDLVGVLMQGGIVSSGMERLGNALGDAESGGLGDLMGRMLGDEDGSGGGLGGMLDGMFGGSGDAGGGLGDLAGSLLGDDVDSDAETDPGSDGAAMDAAVGGGAMAMLAGLAYQALSNRGGSGSALPLGVRGPESEEERDELEEQAALILRAMISAAKADGNIDQDEMQRIVGKLEQEGADDDARELVMQEMSSPLDLDALVEDIPNEQVAAQVYAASLFAIEVDTEAEEEYLEQLAEATGLDEEVTTEIRTSLGVG